MSRADDRHDMGGTTLFLLGGAKGGKGPGTGQILVMNKIAK